MKTKLMFLVLIVLLGAVSTGWATMQVDQSLTPTPVSVENALFLVASSDNSAWAEASVPEFLASGNMLKEYPSVTITVKREPLYGGIRLWVGVRWPDLRLASRTMKGYWNKYEIFNDPQAYYLSQRILAHLLLDKGKTNFGNATSLDSYITSIPNGPFGTNTVPSITYYYDGDGHPPATRWLLVSNGPTGTADVADPKFNDTDQLRSVTDVLIANGWKRKYWTAEIQRSLVTAGFGIAESIALSTHYPRVPSLSGPAP